MEQKGTVSCSEERRPQPTIFGARHQERINKPCILSPDGTWRRLMLEEEGHQNEDRDTQPAHTLSHTKNHSRSRSEDAIKSAETISNTCCCETAFR